MWFDQLRSRVQEHDRLKDDDFRESVIQALNEYNGYHSNLKQSELQSTGDKVVSLPSDWLLGYSRITKLEYPLSDVLLVSNPYAYPIPSIRELSDYSVCPISGVEKLFVMFDFPENDFLRLYYSIPYVEDSIEEIPNHHLAAVLNLSTCYVLLKLSAVYSQSIHYELEADAVDYKSRATDYLKQATWYRDKWEQMMGLGKYSGDTYAQSEFGNEPTSISMTKQLTVDRRHRMFVPSYERKTGILNSSF